jgi:glycosyltransferase involved in cell wall biosynthesis
MIILWLADDMKELDIPILLQNQVKRGLTIDFCKDIRSYKKLIPTLERYPNDLVVTVDDDILYHPDMIENLINAYKDNPHFIYCSRMHRIKINDNKEPLPYREWKWECDDDIASLLNFPTSGAGTLYPPHCFHKDILREDIFTQLCPKADDIWFYTMSILNNYCSKKVFTHKPQYFENKDNQKEALNFYNVANGGNDEQIKKVFDYYHIVELLNHNFK